jgi:PIN domain nuclease of toxin-antitoxin system
MNERPLYATDTHSLLWYLYAPSKLGVAAAVAFDRVAHGEADLIVPVIVIAEIIFIVEANRVPADVGEIVTRLRASPNVRIIPLSVERTLDLRKATVIPEMHDRMIVCEALAYGAILITKDETITRSGLVPTVW